MTDKATELLDDFEKFVGQLEAGAEHANLAKITIRRVETLKEQATDLPITITLPTDDEVAQLKNLALVPTTEHKEVIGSIENLIKAAEFVENIPVDRAKELLGRYHVAMAKATSKPVARSDGPSIRNLGVMLRVACKCGFESTSPKGDWTSLRFQAVKHAKTCEQANPGTSQNLLNDLDRVRESIVTKREDVWSGGLHFTVG